MKPIRLELVDGAILIVYFAFVLGIGLHAQTPHALEHRLLLSGRLIPTWVAGLAFSRPTSGRRK